MSIIRRMMLTTSMLCKPFQVTIDNEMFWTAIIKRFCPGHGEEIYYKRFCPGHGEEYYYEDDGTWTSLCLALPPPQPNVRLLKTHFVLPLFRADSTFRGRLLQFLKDGHLATQLVTPSRTTGIKI